MSLYSIEMGVPEAPVVWFVATPSVKNELWSFRNSRDCAWWSTSCKALLGWHADRMRTTSSKMRHRARSEKPDALFLCRRSNESGCNASMTALGFSIKVWFDALPSNSTLTFLKVRWVFFPANGYGRLTQAAAATPPPLPLASCGA